MFRSLLALSAVASLAFACGGSVTVVEETSPTGGGNTNGGSTLGGGQGAGTQVGGAPQIAGHTGAGAGPTTGGHPTAGGHPSMHGGNTTQQGGGGSGGLNQFVDPGCPDPGQPIEDFECDPNGPSDQCGDGEGCSPFVTYPDSPCDKETYGAVCQSVGPGQQGDPCDQGCAAKNICVITGEGTQCVEICDLNAAQPCPDGLICGTVDIPGVGGCI